MAVHANSRSGDASIWHLISEGSPGRLAFAFRLAIICTLVAVIAELYKTPDIALTVYVAFFLNEADRMSSMLLTVAMAVIVTIVVGLLLVLAGPVLGSPGLRVLTMAVVSFVLMFLASASKLKPVASTVALVVAYALDVLGSAPFGELATRALLYAWLFVGIPALVSAVVNLLIAPSPRSTIQKEIAERLRMAAGALRKSDHNSVHGWAPPLEMGDAEMQAHLRLVRIERTSSDEEISALTGALDCIVTVLSAVQLMLNEPGALPPERIRRTIENTLVELADIFAAGGYPASVAPVILDGACTRLAVAATGFLNGGLTQFGELQPGRSAGKSEEQSAFLVPDAFTNPKHVRFAIKVTAAAMLCYLFYSVLNWPGIHTALITCFIVSLGTAAETVEKLRLRVCGCLVGAGMGLSVMLWVVPAAGGVGDLAWIVFTGAFLGAWIAGGDKHISYAGFQIAFAYFLCVIQGPSPSFDMVVARDRVIGILLGNVVSWFVATRVWPVSVGPRIDMALRSVEHRLGGIGETIDKWSRRRLVAEVHSVLQEITSDIHLAAYEPAWVRPECAWLDARRDAVQAVQELKPPLLAIAELAPEPVNLQFGDLLNITKSANKNSSVNESPLDDSLMPLGQLLRSRIEAFQSAMSQLDRVEEHG